MSQHVWHEWLHLCISCKGRWLFRPRCTLRGIEGVNIVFHFFVVFFVFSYLFSQCSDDVWDLKTCFSTAADVLMNNEELFNRAVHWHGLITSNNAECYCEDWIKQMFGILRILKCNKRYFRNIAEPPRCCCFPWIWRPVLVFADVVEISDQVFLVCFGFFYNSFQYSELQQMLM